MRLIGLNGAFPRMSYPLEEICHSQEPNAVVFFQITPTFSEPLGKFGAFAGKARMGVSAEVVREPKGSRLRNMISKQEPLPEAEADILSNSSSSINSCMFMTYKYLCRLYQGPRLTHMNDFARLFYPRRCN